MARIGAAVAQKSAAENIELLWFFPRKKSSEERSYGNVETRGKFGPGVSARHPSYFF